MLLYYILIPFAWLLWHIGFRIRVEGRENLKRCRPKVISWRPPMFPPSTRCSSSLPGGAGGWWCSPKGAVRDQRLSDVVLPLLRRCVCAAPRTRWRSSPRRWRPASRARPCSSSRRAPAKRRKTAAAQERPVRHRGRCGVDVVPCRILYDTPDGKMHLFCKVRVIYGEPMPAAQFAMEGRRDTKNCVPTSRPCWMRGRRWDGEENVMEIKVAKTAGSALA